MSKKIVVIGGVAAGATAAAKARRVDENAQITVVEKSGYISYANCGLPYYLGGVIPKRGDILLHTPESFSNRFNAKVFVNSKATFIDKKMKKVIVESTDGEFILDYDKLIIAVGGAPIIPPIKGIEKVPYFFVRNVEDVDNILNKIEGKKNALVVGAGYIGIEVSEALYHLNISTTVVEISDNILTGFDPECSLNILEEMKRVGIKVLTSTSLQEVVPQEDGTLCFFSDGRSEEFDMIFLCTGVKPDISLAKTCGIKIGENGGIITNKYMETLVQDIYAAGDVVEKFNPITGKHMLLPLAGPANREGRVAGCNAAGGDMTFPGAFGASVVTFNESVVARTGLSLKQSIDAGFEPDVVYLENAQHAEYYPGAKFIFLKLIFDKKSGRILGAVASGSEGVARRIDVISTAIYGKMTVFDLENLELCYSPSQGSAKDIQNFAGFVASNQMRGEGYGITPDNFLKIYERDWDFTLLDVRTKAEFRRYNLNGSININVNELRDNLDKIDKEKPVFVYCAVGFRGYLAIKILRNRGFKAYNILGGIEAINRFEKIHLRRN